MQDLLTEQINLTYRIFDLRMLLERSLTDRLDTNGKTRLQAVVGLNLTLDPPENSRDQAAYVEMTIRPKAGNKPSLVGQMPEQDIQHFGIEHEEHGVRRVGGDEDVHSELQPAQALTSVLPVSGLGHDRTGRDFTFQREGRAPIREVADTSSSSGEASANEIVFGWEFRPVLGRRSVAPGPRELFAILSLDGIDGTPLDAKEL